VSYHENNKVLTEHNKLHQDSRYRLVIQSLHNLQTGCLIIGAASFNSLGLIKSGPYAFVGYITFRTSSTSFSHNLISLIYILSTCQSGFTKGDSAANQYNKRFWQSLR
jgi:hypothetical protein